MKKFVSGMLVGMLLMCGIAVAGQIAEQVDYKILVNGQLKYLAKQPVLIDNSTYLPLRVVAELLGYQVNFDGTKGEINLTNVVVSPTTPPKSELEEVKPTVVRPKMYVNGVEKVIDYDMLLKDGIYYYPATKILQAFELDRTQRIDSDMVFTYKGKDIMISKGEWFIYGDSSAVPVNLVVERLGWAMKVEQDKLVITY